MDILTFDGGRRVPTDSCAAVEGSSDCGSHSFCNARLTIEGIGGDGDRAPKAHKADDDNVTMHFDYDCDLEWERCYQRCLGKI